jgi:hypothetical protein
MKRLSLVKSMKYSFFITGFIIIMLHWGCVVYVPNVVNSPLLSSKGEIQANLNYGYSGFDPQLSAAVSDHVGLMINGSFRNSEWSSMYFTKSRFVEGGAGYFTKFEEYGIMEVYGGAGFGNIDAYYEDIWTGDPVAVNSVRYFIQPAIGMKSDYFQGSFASRMVLLDLDLGNESKTLFFIEPAITLKGGSKNIKGVFQVGFSLPLSNVMDNFYQPMLCSFGIQATFGGKGNKPQTPR